MCSIFNNFSFESPQYKRTETIKVFRIVLGSSVVFSVRGDVLFPPCQRTQGQNVYFYVLLSSLYFPVLLNLINYAQLLSDFVVFFSSLLAKGNPVLCYS